MLDWKPGWCNMEGTDFVLETEHIWTCCSMWADYGDVGVQWYQSCILSIPVIHTACRKSGWLVKICSRCHTPMAYLFVPDLWCWALFLFASLAKEFIIQTIPFELFNSFVFCIWNSSAGPLFQSNSKTYLMSLIQFVFNHIPIPC